MQVIAALGDAPTAVIAVVAIGLGLFFAARGPREKRAAGGAGGGEPAGPAMVTLPVASAPEAEPGFVGPEGEIVGHGLIRLGVHGPLGAEEAPAPAPQPMPAPAPLAEPAVAEAPLAEPEPEPEPAPAPEAEPEPAAVEPPTAEHAAAPADEPAQPKDPAWRIAARAANDAVHFRQGAIKVGGKPAGKRKDH